ncbi:TadE/TadG family type IV pilus assembly protein [Hoeflea sp.]|uniref:TadE/TadG family type IV pilus assembly protein n=1 Tax=Hoeflea sp. TaxID=1940281 RepID=UPI00198FE72E|nr:TadE/TadG family type IV pilus assembly protein [Hoeflea sp.]MBC7285326.1 pilus assembly protein [Hoeflea sp.]
MRRKKICILMDYIPRMFHHKLTAIFSADRGASAVEFALLAPFLIVALLGTADIGRALAEQMAIGSLLRTGAQSALAGGDLATINQVLDVAKGDPSVVVGVARICACPENSQAPVDCSTTCTGQAPTNIYYSLDAEKMFSGIFLSSIPLSRSLQVQVR